MCCRYTFAPVGKRALFAILPPALIPMIPVWAIQLLFKKILLKRAREKLYNSEWPDKQAEEYSPASLCRCPTKFHAAVHSQCPDSTQRI